MTEEKNVLEEKNKEISYADRAWSTVAYIWVFAFIPLMLRRRRPFVFFHARQGVVLFVAEIILTLIFPIPVLGWLVGIFGYLVCAIFSIRGILSALAGKKWILPWMGKYAERIKI